jgi:Cyclophilin type peptidyl-prolyl cis-trans isomerase/CLD
MSPCGQAFTSCSVWSGSLRLYRHQSYRCLVCAAAGDLNIELHSDLAPRAAENFLVLADKGYYTGTKFHRSIKNFMVQVGLQRCRFPWALLCTQLGGHCLAGSKTVGSWSEANGRRQNSMWSWAGGRSDGQRDRRPVHLWRPVP